MTVINTAYKPGGLIEISSDNPDENSEANDANIASDVNENLFDDDLLIYPNPTSDFITITLSNNGLQPFAAEDKVQIFDMLGIEVISVETGLRPVSTKVVVSHLPAGVYFLKIGDKVEKFVKM